MIGFALAVLLASAPSEAEVLRAVQDDFERAGRTTPQGDPALTAAARQVAERALAKGAQEAASLLRVTAAVSRNGGWDPSPVAVVLRGDPSQLLATLKGNGLSAEPISLVGVGLARQDDAGALAVLLARRRIDLEPFPRSIPRSSALARRLCGILRAPLTSAEVYVTRPRGQVDRAPMASARGRQCASITFPSLGRHTVEVLATGPRGPEVAALFFVDVGEIHPAQEDLSTVEPATEAAARVELLARINALRANQGVPPVSHDSALEAVAQGWADRLAQENFFAHVAPDGSDLKARLRQSGYRFAAAGENLGLSSGPLAAHFGIEHSPGHRRNLLDPAHRRLGIGLGRRADGMTVLVEVLAEPATDEGDPVRAAYRAIEAERASRGLKPLKRNPVLEALAQAHAHAAADAHLAKAQLPGRPGLSERVFQALDEVKTVAIDIVVVDAPRPLLDSKSLLNPRTSMVGVGVVRAEPASGEPAHYWIVVIYAESSRP